MSMRRVDFAKRFGKPTDPEGQRDAKFTRLMRRMEHCANARDESTKILSERTAERDLVKDVQLREQHQLRNDLATNKKVMAERWRGKLSSSPYLNDLVSEHEKKEETLRVRAMLEERKGRILSERKQLAANQIFQQALQETSADELGILRAEKRALDEKHLMALRDVEKTRSKQSKIDADRRQKALERQQLLLQQKLRAI